MYLGVDGGGTKTAFCLLDDDGVVVAESRQASMYYFTDGIELVEKVLRAGVAEVCETARTSVGTLTSSFVGIPCYGEVSADLPELDAILGRALGDGLHACGNDMVCGWAGSLGGGDGINVVSGTGSIAYGERGGASWRAGGWGELFGDEGSGYWVAIQGLNAFTRMSDGRLPPGPLVDAVRQALDLTTDLDVVDIALNRWHGDRAKIAAVSHAVARASHDGDATATEILRTAGRELALLVDVVADALGFDAEDAIPVSYSGGMFTAPLVLESFTEHVRTAPRSYEVRLPLLPPHVGAAVYAARLAGRQFDAEQLRRLQSPAPTSEGLPS
ncbi:N-acetylglucosamine kinase [Cellulomonas sp. URHE0023]|uniref:N-acetylglucosamine kinase n=1 Tax=Cellulomonas sp. URHE0023 TaxID=1380354 RepID=UPI00047F615A|nr:BadF/BadG/BcrA/BcrD ATPase family protein [Cellulomonas sp. URHE0023]